jgi:hypothetical protein
MAEYRFSWALFGGSGSITINGDEPEPFYEEGTSLTILGTFDSGFSFGTYNINNNFLSSGTNPWTFNMPSRDVKLRVNLTGRFTPTDVDYQLKYFTETCDQSNQDIRVEIYEYDYDGAATQKDSSGFLFRWGNFGQDEIDPIVRSSFNFGLVGMRDEYFELIEGGDRKWKVKVLISGPNTDITDWKQVIDTRFYKSIAYGNGKFVALRQTNSTVAISTDAINWTTHLISGFFASEIRFGDGIFVSVGGVLGAQIFTSLDGLNWTSRTPAVSASWTNVHYGNGLWVAVAGNSYTSGAIMTSPDAITWTSRTMPAGVGGLYGLTYGNGVWVSTTIATPATVIISYDGIDWTDLNTGFGSEEVLYSNGVFTTGNKYSTDGINWFSTNVNISARGITFGNGYFVLVPSTSNNIYYSTSGTNWTTTPAASAAAFLDITFGNNTFVAVGQDTIFAPNANTINYLQFVNPLFWEGYINNSTLTINEIGIKEVMQFTASDGLNSFGSKRVNEQYFDGFSGNTFIGGFFGALNQTFPLLRPINVACEIYETRLDTNDCVFEQILIPSNAVFTDGDIPLYLSSNGITENTSVYISEFLESLLKPFLCRVFLWRNEFYIISLAEFSKDSYRLFNYNTDGSKEDISTITPGMDVSCKFTAGQRTGRPVYTEFTGTLQLGVLDYSSRGGIYEEPFSIDSWQFNLPNSSYPGTYQLRLWNYVSSIPSNQPSSYPTGTNPARIQYVSDSLGEYAKIWGTSSVNGTADLDISFIELDSTRVFTGIPIAQDLANTLSFQLEFIFEPRFGGDLPRPNTNAGVMINIGSSYLSFDGVSTFTWVSTFTVMEFGMNSLYSWNKLDITNVVVPEDGNVIIRLYEVITTNASSVDKYTVGYRNMSLKIEENDAFATAEISEKFITDESYSNVYEDVKFNIGDVDTENSSSAIRLDLAGYGYPNSQAWSRDGVESAPLIQIFLQELANIKGKQNHRLILTLPRDAANPLEIKPYQNIEYDGYYWMVIAMEVDLMANSWRLELARLDQIGS